MSPYTVAVLKDNKRLWVNYTGKLYPLKIVCTVQIRERETETERNRGRQLLHESTWENKAHPGSDWMVCAKCNPNGKSPQTGAYRPEERPAKEMNI